MIAGIGVDIVDLARFERAVARTPKLLDRLFAESEQAQGARRLAVHSLAARFAAKEALIKALGGSGALAWHDMQVVRGVDRAPSFAPTAGLTRELRARGGDRVHLSMTHDGGIATAFVVVEGTAVQASGASGAFGGVSALPSTLEPGQTASTEGVL